MEYTVELITDFLKDAENFDKRYSQIEKEYTDKIKQYQKERDKKIKQYTASMKDVISQQSLQKESALMAYDADVVSIDKEDALRRKQLYDQIIPYISNNGTAVDLNREIARFFSELYANSEQIGLKRKNRQDLCANRLHEIDKNVQQEMMKFFENILQYRRQAEKEYETSVHAASEEKQEELNSMTELFLNKYPPQIFKEECMRIYHLEPDIHHYTCASAMPSTVKIGNIVCEFSDLKLSDPFKKMLMRHYYFLIRYSDDASKSPQLSFPYSLTFNHEFNYIFHMNYKNRELLTNRICSIAMRLFMMMPTGKVNFTFLDPNLAQTFAMFGQLVETDDRSSKVISEKIWSDERDIQQRLQILTEHISNITQRCLQGKYQDIRQYNEVAGQNAEPYHVLMIMDFPQNFNEHSLKMLKQISTAGPKCGVYIIILKDHDQYAEMDERRIQPLVDNILAGMTNFIVQEQNILFDSNLYQNRRLQLELLPLYRKEVLDRIIPILKEGIRTADKVVIPYDRMLEKAQINHSTADCIRIPIGVHGANEVQYLTLGTGGSHHALIAGMAGSGKSTLLHNIIFGLLNQYDPDELSIYLVDFKRGVEFKIYADYVLPAFKVIAIESEREFGYNVLAALEREQKERADRFTRSNTYQLSEYRANHPKLPRILVIMDEFQELFSDGNDELSKKSADMLERIVRQGRAFGVHLMLATQSYSNIRGIDSSVFNQMAVRIVLKCSDTDANLMLEDGANSVNQISIDDAGRAIYNSEAGNKAYNSHFRVAFIPPAEYKERLENISRRTKPYADPQHPTRVLLTNIENNAFSIFSRFPYYDGTSYQNHDQLYIGESLELDSNMALNIQRKAYSNILMVGNDTDMARNMFTFAVMSVCINYWIVHRQAPEKPIITLLNAVPLYDSYFGDTLKILVKHLPAYIRYVTNDDSETIRKIVSDNFERMTSVSVQEEDQYFFVFGYQRTEDLKSEDKLSQANEMDDIFNITQSAQEPQYSVKEMMNGIFKGGAQRGIHTVIWQDSFDALFREDNGMISYFSMRVAFGMTPENYSRFIGYNDSQSVGTKNAILYNKATGNQKFRPYQRPNESWLMDICHKLS